ncbi:hypothetical protein FHR37_002780 [Actinopolymorpha cephalotaxi]|uniref:Uncharacterized protein n=1 Tax=Actinopolymorpha cephalotaxi TaxID=504797 RepID=A0ABX2S3S3_9ACTN|nr:hypothetical protein [Actinopolymorpha cephalotaxi]
MRVENLQRAQGRIVLARGVLLYRMSAQVVGGP